MMNSSKFKDAHISHSKMGRKGIYIFFTLLITILTFVFFLKKTKVEHVFEPPEEKKEISKTSTHWDRLRSSMINNGYNLWGKNKVSDFYKTLTPIVMNECLKKGTPPGAIIAIASLESGYGTGYVAKVTGNILSLNAKSQEIMLPPLTLPTTKDQIFIIDSSELTDMLAKGYPFELSKRPPSLKKDYRPEKYRGSETFLDYFMHHPDERYIAWKSNINDLLYGRINATSPIKVYREAQELCNNLKMKKSLRKLLSNKTSEDFISMIGGKPQSFNIRTSWVEKSHRILSILGIDLFLKQYLLLFSEYYDLSEWNWDI